MANWQYTPDQEEVHAYADNLAKRFFEKLRERSELFNLAMMYLRAEPYGYSPARGLLQAIEVKKMGLSPLNRSAKFSRCCGIRPWMFMERKARVSRTI